MAFWAIGQSYFFKDNRFLKFPLVGTDPADRQQMPLDRGVTSSVLLAFFLFPLPSSFFLLMRVPAKYVASNPPLRPAVPPLPNGRNLEFAVHFGRNLETSNESLPNAVRISAP